MKACHATCLVGSLCLVLDLLYGSIGLNCIVLVDVDEHSLYSRDVVLHDHIQRMEHNDCIAFMLALCVLCLVYDLALLDWIALSWWM